MNGDHAFVRMRLHAALSERHVAFCAQRRIDVGMHHHMLMALQPHGIWTHRVFGRWLEPHEVFAVPPGYRVVSVAHDEVTVVEAKVGQPT